MPPNRFGKFLQLGSLECFAWVGRGLVNLVNGDELKRIAILHDGSPLIG